MARPVFQQAKRENVWAKVLFGGPAGSGKTYSALRVATGLFEKVGGAGIAAIDTENGRIRYYADKFDFFDLQIEAPFEPEKYVEAIDAAAAAGFKVLIIDSISHEWKFCTDLVEKIPGTNSFVKWAKITPRHDAFMEKVLQSPMHVLATVRGKDAYSMEDRNGKTTPKKVGIGFTQRADVEYDYTVTFNIDQESHIASVMKDNTGIFDGRFEVLTEKHGEAIYEWANSGKAVAAKFQPMKVFEEAQPIDIPEEQKPAVPPVESLSEVVKSITALFKENLDKGADKEEMYGAISEINGGKKSWLDVKDIEKAKEIKSVVEKFTNV